MLKCVFEDSCLFFWLLFGYLQKSWHVPLLFLPCSLHRGVSWLTPPCLCHLLLYSPTRPPTKCQHLLWSWPGEVGVNQPHWLQWLELWAPKEPGRRKTQMNHRSLFQHTPCSSETPGPPSRAKTPTPLLGRCQRLLHPCGTVWQTNRNRLERALYHCLLWDRGN